MSLVSVAFPFITDINERIIQDGVYIIATNGLYNQVLSIVGKSTQAESSVNISKRTREAHQFFLIKYDENYKSYTIMALNSHLFLGVNKKEDSNYNNSLILQNSKSQNFIIHWTITFDNGFSFQPKGYDYNLQYIEDTKIALLANASKTPNQNFFIKTISVLDSGLYYIHSKLPSKSYITFSKNDEEKSFLCSKNESIDQLFYVVFDESDGCYSIINISNLKCLSSELKQTTFYNVDYQKWIIGTYDLKSYFIMLKYNDLLLCNPASKTNDKQTLCLKAFNNKLSFNCDFHFQSKNDTFYKKIKSALSLQFLNHKNMIKNIREKVRFRYQHKILEQNLTQMAQRIINSQLFENSFILNHLEIPLNIIDIHEKAFSNCFHIKYIKCHPKWLKLFPNPTNVENIVIPDDVELIDNDSLKNFPNVKYLSLPNSLKFESCDISLFNEIRELKTFKGDPIFLKIIQKDKLTSINIPFFVKIIPESICAGCESLNEVNIEENSMLQIIQPKAFAGCKSLRFMVIPESVTNIAPDAFSGCNEYFELILKNPNQEMSKEESLIIKPDVRKITEDYKRYLNITAIEISAGVQECEPQVLESFEKLNTVKCDPKWLNRFNTNQIVKVSIPDETTELKKRDFENLVHLQYVEIPESVQNIENGTFDNCKELSSVKCGTHHFKYLNKEQIKSVCLNEEVECIKETDFEGFSNLETCKIHESIKEINPRAFIKCKKLMKIDHPDGKLLINNSVSIDDNITKISKEDFKGWTNLKSLMIPNSVKEIEKDAFKDCINLKSLTCDPKWFPFFPKDSIQKIVIPNFVREIKKGQFDDFNSLIYIRLPKEIKITDPSTFDSCESLKIIRCKSSIFNKLTDKTIERCTSKLQTKYENPVFNFQPDRSKVFDETELIPDDDLDETSSLSFSNPLLTSSITKNSLKQVNLTVDELVAIDGFNVNPYKHAICNVLWCIQSGESIHFNKPNDSTILEISNVCGAVCYKISKRFRITPRVVQIYAILRLADEILNKPESKGSIAEIKPGEGKSLIITILSIILVKYNRTVDITTSNLKLAKRYKTEQSKYFDLFHIPTDVFYDKRNDSDFLSKSMISTSHDYANNFEEYNQSEFHNFNIKAFDCPVVYSTNCNLEYFYLHFLFSLIPRKREFDVVLIDGVDNMLIDELDSPSIISKEINYSFAPNIICLVYAARNSQMAEIISILKHEFPNTSDFNEQDIELLRKAALEANRKKINVDYIVEDNKIIIIDHETGYKMPNSHWPIYLHQMVELKESIIPTPILLSFCQITQQAYFKLYNKIAGITGTLGSETDENILKEGYEVNTFKVPRNISSNMEVYYKNRPESMDKVFNIVNYEIISEMQQRKRPVLVIWDSKFNAESFIEYYDLQNVGCIFGDDQSNDEDAIESAGNPATLTITTSTAIRGIDLTLTNKALKSGGLHIVIPMKISNIRTLEQHFAIAGRQGQPGSMTILISKEDQYIKTPSFNQKNIILDKLQTLFAKDVKENLSWMLCGPRENDFGDETIFPFAATYIDILNILSRRIFLIINEAKASNEIKLFQDLSWIMVQTAWGAFFTCIQNDNLNNNNMNYCTNEYNQFIRKLNEFISFKEGKTVNSALNFLLAQFTNERNHNFLIYKRFKISSSNVTLVPKNEDTTLETAQTQERKSILSKLTKIYNDNRNRIPGIRLLPNIPDAVVSDEITDINFIKMALKLAQGAYDGKFSINRVIFASETNDLFKPKFYCIENLNRLFIVTRGSVSDEDWVTDFTCEEVSTEIDGTIIYIHKGFYMAAHYILSNITELIERNYKKIYFVGHSYGAAVSNVLCLLTKTYHSLKNKNIFSLAFAPPPSMSKVPAYVQDCMFSFINKNDIIPHMSICNIKNTISFEKTSVKEFIDSKLRYIKAIKFATNYAKMADRIMTKYKDHIFSILDSVDKEFHVQKNIGNIFLIGVIFSNKLKNYRVHESDLTDILFFVSSMFSDHSLKEYIFSFEVIESYE